MSAFQKLISFSKEELIGLLKEHKSKVALLRTIGINPKHSKCVRYLVKFVKDNNVDITHHGQTRGLHNLFTKEQIQQFANDSLCWTDLIHKLGRRFYGNMISPVKRLVKYYDINTSHFNASLAAARNRKILNNISKPNEEVFIEHSTLHRASIKRRIINGNLISYKCRDCNNIGTWNDKEIILELEHINGINNDHRLENLCFLCPNCHSQTATYGNKIRA